MEDFTHGCGLWLPEDQKANMSHGRGNFVACGRLPSPVLSSEPPNKELHIFD